MPIYEYRCRPCGRRTQVLTLRASEPVDAVCTGCGSREMDRLPSRFALPRSEDSRLDALADGHALSDLESDDPRSVARWMRRIGSELGDDVDRAQMDEMVDEIEAGGGPDDGREPGGSGGSEGGSEGGPGAS